MNNFLLEILTEELPYKFVESAISQLETSFTKLLSDNGLKYENIDVYGTPRRLAVIIRNLADKQEDVERDFRGPILSIALNPDGSYSQAAIGFAKKNQIEPENLYKKDNYIWAHIKQTGESARSILQKNIENLILSMQGAHFMRWKDYDVKFSRPIENVLALFNEEVLSLKIIDKEASDTTKGHRFSRIKEVKINNPLTYTEQLKEANVIVDQRERRDFIIKSATSKASEIGAEIHFEKMEELLDEVTYITEFPKPILCSFDEKYLAIPDIVNVTVMSTHQRYFPLYKNGKLLNHFITMANFVGDDDESIQNIQRGNQRVVCARLEDGIFFYNEDTKKPLSDKVNDLAGMTFQRDLGTLLDKTNRIIKLSEILCNELKLEKEDILRTALLCKADLSTKLVFEFTELQGFIGEDYALKSGEKPNVARGISEHYYPLNATSETAAGIEGQIVGIADKIDTICAVFLSTQENKKRRPTGSNDPLGVRRAVLGVLRTVLDGNLKIDILSLVKESVKLISEEFGIPVKPETIAEIEEFFINRLIVMFEKTYPQNILRACAELKNSALCNLNSYFERVKLTQGVSGNVIENALRVLRIMPKDYNNFREINTNLFVEDEEKNLYNFAINVSDPSQFEELSDYVAKFFDKVLVMDKDENIKENRISLLNLIKNKFEILCNFEYMSQRN